MSNYAWSSPGAKSDVALGDGRNTLFAGFWGSDGSSLLYRGGDGRDDLYANAWNSDGFDLVADLGNGNNATNVDLFWADNPIVAITTGNGNDRNSLFAYRTSGLTYVGSFGAGNDRFSGLGLFADDSRLLVDMGQEHDWASLGFYGSNHTRVDAYFGDHGRFSTWGWRNDDLQVDEHRGESRASEIDAAIQAVFDDPEQLDELLLGL